MTFRELRMELRHSSKPSLRVLKLGQHIPLKPTVRELKMGAAHSFETHRQGAEDGGSTFL